MSDDLPDLEYERLKVERQRQQIEITMLDQEIQVADLRNERKTRAKDLADLNGSIGAPIEGKDLESKRRELARRREALAATDIRVRIAEIDDTIRRHTTNIDASHTAVEELSMKIDAMKGGEPVG